MMAFAGLTLPRPRRHWTPRYVRDRVQLGLWERRHPDAPWLVAGAVHLLETWLRSDDIVVEFGSGRSTLWFSERVGRVISIEHDPDWYGRVRDRLDVAGRKNVRYHCVPIDPAVSADDARDAAEPYLRAAAKSLDDRADVVLVDGILRGPCARWAVDNVRDDGLIVVDNANRYLPHVTRSPASLGPAASPPSADWRAFLEAVTDWRHVWFSNGVTDTAVYFREPRRP
jgi:hypothetical protein